MISLWTAKRPGAGRFTVHAPELANTQPWLNEPGQAALRAAKLERQSTFRQLGIGGLSGEAQSGEAYAHGVVIHFYKT